MFFESQLFGVLVGAVIAGLAGVVLEIVRRKSDRSRSARVLRQQTNADGIRAVYDVRESLIRLFVVTDNPQPVQVRKGKGAPVSGPDYRRDREDAFTGYDRAGRRLGEMIHLVEAFGTVGVYAALREFAQITSWYGNTYLQTAIDQRFDFQGLEKVMEFLIAAACSESRTDSDAGYKVTKSKVAYERGNPTWLAHLKEEPAYRAAEAAQGTSAVD
jgi:hypothetical protein